MQIGNQDRELNPDEQVETDPEGDATPKKTPVEEPKTPEATPREEPKDPPKDPDPVPNQALEDENQRLKDKLADSSREAIRLAGENETQRDQINSLTNDEQVTDDEVKIKYPNFEYMTENEQSLARDNVLNSKSQTRINRILSEDRASRERTDLMVATIGANPDLAGREGDFKAYASKPKHKNTSLEILAKAFLHDISDEIEDKKLESKPKDPAPRRGLEGRSAGTEGAPKSGPTKLTSEQIKDLRKNDNKEYMRMIRDGEL